jgi:hypothetical protein
MASMPSQPAEVQAQAVSKGLFEFRIEASGYFALLWLASSKAKPYAQLTSSIDLSDSG